MKNIYIIGIVILVIIGAFTLVKKPVVSPQTKFTADKTIDIKGFNYAFDLKEIKVKLNDKVKINFTNTEGSHDFIIDEFNVATKQISSGQTETVEFVADKTGTFQYYCSVGQHRANGMWGNLVVE